MRYKGECQPMLARKLPYLIIIIFIIGITLSLLYKNQKQENLAEPSPQITTPLTKETTMPQTSAIPTPTSSSTNASADLTVDPNGLSKATATLKTPYGPIRFKFYPNDAPQTVRRIIELIQKGFYNGLTFHRVVPGFVIQGGDPTGTGMSGSGQKLKAEFNNRHHSEGAVAMARAQDPDSADSQFYITLGPQPQLDHSYTVFGQVIEGMDAARKIQVGDKMTTVGVE